MRSGRLWTKRRGFKRSSKVGGGFGVGAAGQVSRPPCAVTADGRGPRDLFRQFCARPLPPGRLLLLDGPEPDLHTGPKRTHSSRGRRRRKARLGQRLGCFALVRADSRPTVRQNVTCGRNTGGAGQRKGPNVISTDNDRETYHLYFLFTRRRFQCKRHAAVLHRSSGTRKLLA